MDLTKAERLYFKRRRAGITQGAAAKEYGVTRRQYINWEQGRQEPDIVGIRNLELRPHEMCVLLRKRAGLTQQDVADNMQRSCNWVRMMEQGTVPCTELQRFWQHG